MPSIAGIVGQLAAAPKPVICLDTCDILDVVQCLGWEKATAARNTACVPAVRRLLTTLAAYPDKALVVITELVATEWHQNIPEIRANAILFLSQVDLILKRSHQAAVPAGTALPAFTDLSASALVDDLVTLSTAVLNQAIRIDLDPALIDLAVQRVMAKRRPSHDGHLKDSVHFEHYLELARQLRAAGIAEECVFVSKNRKDFWDDQKPSIHPDLAPEIADHAVRMSFFGSIEAAIGYLHL
jgi:hypothetical protein